MNKRICIIKRPNNKIFKLSEKNVSPIENRPKKHRAQALALAIFMVPAFIIGCVPTSWGDASRPNKVRGAIDAVSAGSPPQQGNSGLKYYYFIKSNYHEIDMDDKKALKNMKMASSLDPLSYYFKMETARLLARNGDRDAALKYAIEAVTLNPTIQEPRKFAAWLSASAGLWDAAINQYKEILRLNPGNIDALANLGALYSETGRNEEAEKTFKELTSTSPSATTYYYLASFYNKSGLIDEAITAYKESIKLDSSFTDALSELAMLYEDRNELKLAERSYNALIKANPDLVMPRARLAHLLFKQNRKKEGEKILNDIDIKNQSGPVQFRLGLLFLEQGLNKEAAEVFESFLQKSPRNEKALYFLATTQLELQQFDKARGNLAKIPNEGEMFVDARLLMASIIENEDKEKRLAESLKIINTAIKVRPNELRLRLAQAMLTDDLGDTKKARQIALSASKKFPTQAEVFFRLGVFEDKLENKKASIEAMKKAVELNPGHADALNYLAYTWAEQRENLQEALSLAERADNIKPESGYIIDTLAWIHYQLGNKKKALELLEKAVPLSGYDPVVLGHLGDVLHTLGRLGEAVKTYQQALESEYISLQPKLREELNGKIQELSQQ